MGLPILVGQRAPTTPLGAGTRPTNASHASGARRVIADAKLTDEFRLHDLRRRCVTTWLAEGQSPVHVKEAVGHASLATTMKYTHLLPEHLRALVDEPANAAPNEKGTSRGRNSVPNVVQRRAPRAG